MEESARRRPRTIRRGSGVFPASLTSWRTDLQLGRVQVTFALTNLSAEPVSLFEPAVSAARSGADPFLQIRLWASSMELQPGEERELVFTVTVPLGSDPGTYAVRLEFTGMEMLAERSFEVTSPVP